MPESIFPEIPETRLPVEQRIAADMLRNVDAECLRRIGQHCDWWSAVWESPEATPQEIVAAMGASAGLFFTIASVNKTQIATVAQVLGKTTAELGVPDKCMTTPVTVTLNSDGTATLSESALPSVVSIASEESA
jgi:hypothetical protein